MGRETWVDPGKNRSIFVKTASAIGIFHAIAQLPGRKKEAKVKSLKDSLDKYQNIRGLTNKDIANVIGVSRMEIYRWKNGTSKPGNMSIRRLQSLGIYCPDAEFYDNFIRKGMSAGFTDDQINFMWEVLYE